MLPELAGMLEALSFNRELWIASPAGRRRADARGDKSLLFCFGMEWLLRLTCGLLQHVSSANVEVSRLS